MTKKRSSGSPSKEKTLEILRTYRRSKDAATNALNKYNDATAALEEELSKSNAARDEAMAKLMGLSTVTAKTINDIRAIAELKESHADWDVTLLLRKSRKASVKELKDEATSRGLDYQVYQEDQQSA